MQSTNWDLHHSWRSIRASGTFSMWASLQSSSHGRPCAAETPWRNHFVAQIYTCCNSSLFRFFAFKGYATSWAWTSSARSLRNLPSLPFSRDAPSFHPLWPYASSWEKIKSTIFTWWGPATSRSFFQFGPSGTGWRRIGTCKPQRGFFSAAIYSWGDKEEEDKFMKHSCFNFKLICANWIPAISSPHGAARLTSLIGSCPSNMQLWSTLVDRTRMMK